jgi:hypothetical protein
MRDRFKWFMFRACRRTLRISPRCECIGCRVLYPRPHGLQCSGRMATSARQWEAVQVCIVITLHTGTAIVSQAYHVSTGYCATTDVVVSCFYFCVFYLLQRQSFIRDFLYSYTCNMTPSHKDSCASSCALYIYISVRVV